MNEKAYLKEIRKGNQEALNAFIETLYPSVYRYVFCKVSGKEEAKDIHTGSLSTFYQTDSQLSK